MSLPGFLCRQGPLLALEDIPDTDPLGLGDLLQADRQLGNLDQGFLAVLLTAGGHGGGKELFRFVQSVVLQDGVEEGLVPVPVLVGPPEAPDQSSASAAWETPARRAVQCSVRISRNRPAHREQAKISAKTPAGR